MPETLTVTWDFTLTGIPSEATAKNISRDIQTLLFTKYHTDIYIEAEIEEDND